MKISFAFQLELGIWDWAACDVLRLGLLHTRQFLKTAQNLFSSFQKNLFFSSSFKLIFHIQLELYLFWVLIKALPTHIVVIIAAKLGNFLWLHFSCANNMQMNFIHFSLHIVFFLHLQNILISFQFLSLHFIVQNFSSFFEWVWRDERNCDYFHRNKLVLAFKLVEV